MLGGQAHICWMQAVQQQLQHVAMLAETAACWAAGKHCWPSLLTYLCPPTAVLAVPEHTPAAAQQHDEELVTSNIIIVT
jgi:hypothetical protein